MQSNLYSLQRVQIFIFIFIFLSFDAIAQSPAINDNSLDIGFQFRPRLEIRDGAFRPLNTKEKPAVLISDRVRLSFDYSYKDVLSVRVSPQSVNIWGQESMVQGAESSGSQFSLFEAWAKLKLSSYWNLKIGRQVISLDDERFFGALDWAQGGRAHDAVSAHFDNKKFKLSGYFAFNQNYKSLYLNNLSNPSGNLYATGDAYPHKWMQTLWATIPIRKTGSVSLLASNVGFQNAISAGSDTTTYFMQTFGANYFFTEKKLSGNLSAYYQCGDNSGGVNTSAWLVAAYAGYKVDKKWTAGIGSDWLSGNDVGKTQNTNRAFNPLFHTGHKFYGNMDYYFSGNGHKNAGLSDTYLKFNYKATSSCSVGLAFHQFFSVGDVFQGTKEFNKNIGQELDLSFTHQINKMATLAGGYSFYINNSTLNYLKNTPNGKDYQQWGWLTLNITPAFFKTKF